MFSTIILARSFPCLTIYMHSSAFGCVTQFLLSNIINIFRASFALYHSLIQTLHKYHLYFNEDIVTMHKNLFLGGGDGDVDGATFVKVYQYKMGLWSALFLSISGSYKD